ncbi:MAG: D-hexose-6-phosphate mutarotase [Lentisphaerae bacterium]|nr:D-hexose-6-phosphate mutarotase [Lentisphaerota bacterium]
MDTTPCLPHIIPGQLDIIDGPGGLPVVRICNAAASAEICLLGAHLLSYVPRGGRDLLWMSREAVFKEGSALRGGIPICWPWFGAPPAGASTSHGYVRYQFWTLSGSRAVSPDCTEARFTFLADQPAPEVWPHAFRLEFIVRVGRSLELSLCTSNTGSVPFTVNQALHTYYNISDISKIRIQGFDGLTYHDAVNKEVPIYRQQQGDITFAAETDAVFMDNGAPVTILDPGYGRKILLERENSASSVVWNPWIDKARRMPDFGDDEYKTMVCVECCNIRADARCIPPGQQHTLKTRISAEPYS